MQLLRLVNGLLEKNPQSRTRRLAAHAPIIVPVYSQVTLVLLCDKFEVLLVVEHLMQCPSCSCHCPGLVTGSFLGFHIGMLQLRNNDAE